MNTGTESPQWAKDLIGHWVVFHDHHHGVPDMKAFVWSTDFFASSPPLQQVRIFADPYENVMESLKTGQSMFGLFATYIQKDEHKIIDVPVELMDWTAEQLSEMKEKK